MVLDRVRESAEHSHDSRVSISGRLMVGAVLACGLGGLLACAGDSSARPGGGRSGSSMEPGGTGATGGSGGAGGAIEADGATVGRGDSGELGTPGTNVDDGSLFHDAGTVAGILAGGSGATSEAGTTTTPDGRGSGIPGDGKSAIGKVVPFGLRALFTQRGVDVTVVVTATRCPAGMHTLTIHEGYACDDPTRGPVWGGGKRGAGIPPIVCNAAQQGTLTYTRNGSDPSTNWTVADQNQTTDVTLHPLMMESQCGTFF
jgi:hypothetical protein